MAAGWGYFDDGVEAWRALTAAADKERARWRALVDVSTLNPEQKQRLWANLRQRHPELAATLQEPAVRDLRELFEAAVHLPHELDREALYD